MTRLALAAAALVLAALATVSAYANDRIGDFVVYSTASDIIALDGEIDAELRMILLALLLPKPQGDD